jgi:hypothetical protein
MYVWMIIMGTDTTAKKKSPNILRQNIVLLLYERKKCALETSKKIYRSIIRKKMGDLYICI